MGQCTPLTPLIHMQTVPLLLLLPPLAPGLPPTTPWASGNLAPSPRALFSSHSAPDLTLVAATHFQEPWHYQEQGDKKQLHATAVQSRPDLKAHSGHCCRPANPSHTLRVPALCPTELVPLLLCLARATCPPPRVVKSMCTASWAASCLPLPRSSLLLSSPALWHCSPPCCG